MGRLTIDHILHWTNVKHDLYTDDRLMTFGYFKDMTNNDNWFYGKYPDGFVVKLSDNVYMAITEFNNLPESPPLNNDRG